MIMKTTYLKEFAGHAKKKIALLPVGTLEWHGHHLPIETDFRVAQKVCELVAKQKPVYVLPPLYLGSSSTKKAKGKLLIGMDKFLGKNLPGSLYYLDPELFAELLVNLGRSLVRQGFTKIYVITGHSGVGQIAALKLAEKKLKNLVALDIYDVVEAEIGEMKHADEYETSLFWACYPAEEKVSRRVRLAKNDDYVSYLGYDPRPKSSRKLGQQLLSTIVSKLKTRIK